MLYIYKYINKNSIRRQGNKYINKGLGNTRTKIMMDKVKEKASERESGRRQGARKVSRGVIAAKWKYSRLHGSLA